MKAKQSQSFTSGPTIATNFFRITNFELFVKPNKYVMSAGIVAISLSVGYIVLMNLRAKNDASKSTYIAVDEEGYQYTHNRKSKWD